MSDKLRPVYLEIQIPYCIQPEKYRPYRQLVGSNEEKNAYLAAVRQELLSYEGSLDGCEVQAIRLSGGSATVMSPDLLGDLLRTVREILPVAAGAECSVDAHPLTIGTPALTGIATGHPNRMELNLCSANEAELQAVACTHSIQHVNNAMRFFGKFHINNIGLRIALGIPGQTEASWHNTLHACAIFHPAHIRVERLQIQDDGEGLAHPNHEACLSLYGHACKYLKENGYLHYGSGLFCLPRHASRLDLLKMNAAEQIGLGLGAVTLLDGYLTRNTNNLSIYLAHAGDYEKTTAEAFAVGRDVLMRSFVEHRLASADGFSVTDFAQRFGCSVPEMILDSLKADTESALLTFDGDRFLPSERLLYQRIST